jgi:predicted amidohydrolase YtcJ
MLSSIRFCRTCGALFLYTALVLIAGCRGPAQTGNSFILVDATIYTEDDASPVVEAMSVIDGRVAMIGDRESVKGAYPDLREVSAGGRAVIPGLIDAHGHLMGLGIEQLQVNLRGAASIEEVLARLREYATTLPEGAWMTGRGWNQALWPQREFPTRKDLDAAFPDRPVWLRRIDGHAAWGNTAALETVGMDSLRALEDPMGGHIVRDEKGEPTGVFVDAAMRYVGMQQPNLTDEQLDQALALATKETARLGLTGVHDAGASLGTIERYKRAIDEGTLNLRVYAMVSGRGDAFEYFCNKPLLDYGDMLTVRSVKMYVDGALGSRGAAMIDDYSDDPGNTGLLRVDPDSFADDVRAALACGYQVNTHAIGDRGNRIVLDAYEAAGATSEGRHRDEHSQVVALDDIPRFAELGVIASMQPTHATSDKNMAEDRVGPYRIKGAYAWRKFAKQGTPLAFGSDFPVEKADPLEGFFAAVTRQDKSLMPEGGWYPEERLSREETLEAFTKTAAWAGFEEDQYGTLSPGKFADFVVLSKDIMTVPSPEILETTVIATYLGGEQIYGDL